MRLPSHATALACSLGMFAGLWIDDLQGRLATLSALCSTGDRDLLYWAQMHYQQLPAMHVGMLAATLLTAPFQHPAGRGIAGSFSLLLHTLVCLGLMWLGMTVGGLVLHRAADGAMSVAGMLGGMALGMLAGLQLGTAVARAR